MKIRNRLNPSDPCFSFEFFPPKTEEGRTRALPHPRGPAPLEPGFVSVTYGAGGSTRERTVDMVTRIKRTGIEAMAHLTCVGHTRDELGLLEQLLADGIENVLALRGDPPAGEREFHAPPGGFRYASELVHFIRGATTASASAARAIRRATSRRRSRDDDLRHLKAKVDAGLDFLITQLFFDNAFYFDFVERARRAGIHVPIVPGIMPITNIEQLDRFTRLCGATVPMRLRAPAGAVPATTRWR